MSYYPLCIALIFALVGCAGPVSRVPGAHLQDIESEIRIEKGDALDGYIIAEQRLFLTAMPLFQANEALCPRKAWATGIRLLSDFDVPHGMQSVAYERQLLNREAKVLAVSPVFDAWDKGVRSGDILLTINGQRIRNSAQATTKLRAIRDKNAPVTMGFVRSGVAYEVDVQMSRICNYAVQYQEGARELNAYATGRAIVLTRGMIDFADDDALGVIIGHELAHNIMHHIPKTAQNTVVTDIAGDVIDVLVGVRGAGDTIRRVGFIWNSFFLSPQFEKEADYVGLYLQARAGQPIDGAPKFWRRMAVEGGHENLRAGLDTLSTHPASAERFVILEQTIAEIDDKQRAGQPLMPNLRTPWNFGERYGWWETQDELGPDEFVFQP